MHMNNVCHFWGGVGKCIILFSDPLGTFIINESMGDQNDDDKKATWKKYTYTWDEVVNFLPQLSQQYGFSPVWILLCSWRLPFWVNLLSQWSHLKGFSPIKKVEDDCISMHIHKITFQRKAKHKIWRNLVLYLISHYS